MKSLIIEDDELVGELLETVLVGLHPGMQVTLAPDVRGARSALQESSFDLVVADWNLPDGSGLQLVKTIRSKDRDLPIVMVSGRSDRDSVLQAAHYGISAYITKPFNVDVLHKRLSALLKVRDDGVSSRTPAEMLASYQGHIVQLPGAIDVTEVLDLITRRDQLSSAQLAERWRDQTGILARLLDVSNGASLRRSGEPIQTLRDAISFLGIPMALNYVLALSLDVSGAMQSPVLKMLADRYRDMTLSISKEAQRLALSLKKSPFAFQKAALLSRVGELAVLRVLNEYVLQGGSLDEAEAEECLRKWAQTFGNELKVQWRLALELREMIGAVHFLPKGSTQEDCLLMRTAALLADGKTETDECRRLMRRLGLGGSQQEVPDNASTN
ncbi:MAG: response regulator [Marinobacter sp.]|nr:response regulator [Marinobacter sp.]